MRVIAAMMCHWSKFDNCHGSANLRNKDVDIGDITTRQETLPYWVRYKLLQHPNADARSTPSSVSLFEGQSYAGFFYWCVKEYIPKSDLNYGKQYHPSKGVLTLARHRIKLSPADQRRYLCTAQAYDHYSIASEIGLSIYRVHGNVLGDRTRDWVFGIKEYDTTLPNHVI